MHYYYSSQAFLVMVFFLACSPFQVMDKKQTGQQEYYVSTEGNDDWSGLLPEPNADSSDGPFATLEKAFQVIRDYSIRSLLSTKSVAVNLRGGTYFFQKTLLLDSLISGTEETPLVIQNYQEEIVNLTGGIKVSGFEPVSDEEILQRLPQVSRGSVWELNLKKLGITNYGELTARGFPLPTYPSPLELFFDHEPMQLARWPNNGWARIDKSMEKKQKSYFYYTGERPENWMKSEDVWLHGFWARDWADSYVKVKQIDTINHKIDTYEPHGTYGYAPKGRYYVLNLLEELDQPGEWYLDRATGILYFWPPAPIKDGEVHLSLLENPIMRLENTSYVHIRGVVFEVARGTAVEISGGQGNQIGKSVFRNIGNHAIEINNGSDNGVSGCDFYNLGDGGVILSGGDKDMLVSAKNYIINSYFHHYNRWVMASKPAIFIHGVGNKIQHNVIHDAPQGAIHLTGNDHLIEYNEIFRMGQETGDIGAFYMGRDFSMQGNIVRYNYFHHMGSPYKYGVKSIYLDDFSGGASIYGNIFYRVQQGVLVNGGSHTLIENNLFIKAKEAIRITHRSASSYKAVESVLQQRLGRVNYQSGIWKDKYPKLENILEKDPDIPHENVIHDNVCISCDQCISIRKESRGSQTIRNNNSIDTEISFMGELSETDVCNLMVKSIPVEKIGLYQDKLRVTWPDISSVRTKSENR